MLPLDYERPKSARRVPRALAILFIATGLFMVATGGWMVFNVLRGRIWWSLWIDLASAMIPLLGGAVMIGAAFERHPPQDEHDPCD